MPAVPCGEALARPCPMLGVRAQDGLEHRLGETTGSRFLSARMKDATRSTPSGSGVTVSCPKWGRVSGSGNPSARRAARNASKAIFPNGTTTRTQRSNSNSRKR